MKAPWVTYRPELKVLDCTIRDGGLINDHQFDSDLVKATYEACVEAGLDYMEIGYRNSKRLFSTKQYGPFRHSDEEEIRKVTGDHDAEATGLKLAVMADAGKSDWSTDVLPSDQSVVDMVRVACYVDQIPEAAEMINDAHDKGYETSCNLMAISTVQQAEIEQALEIIAKTPVDVVCVVDSFGALYREQIDILVRSYMAALEGTNKHVGIHTHNNQQLAFANTIEAIILRCQPHRRHHGRTGPRRRQLPYGAAHRFLAQSEIQAAAYLSAAAGPLRQVAPETRVGRADSLQHHRPAQPASARSHGPACRPRQRQLR